MNHDQQYSIFKLIQSISSDRLRWGEEKKQRNKLRFNPPFKHFSLREEKFDKTYKRGATYPR